MVKNVIGSPAQGDDFYDREREQARVWSRLETDNLLLLAPRRVGKTSLLYRLADTAGEHGFRALHANVARARSEVDLVDTLLTELEKLPEGEKPAKALRKGPFAEWSARVQQVNAVGIGVTLTDGRSLDWRPAADALVEALHADKYRWLVMLDELPIFVLSLLEADPGRARLFLDWLRAARIDRRLGARTRWIVCGSIGLDSVTARARLGDTINDLAHIPLGAFAERDAITFLEQLGISYDLPLSRDLCRLICQRIGWPIPFHLNLMFAALRDQCEDAGVAPSEAAVDAAYARLLNPCHRSAFDTWVQRLEAELGAVDGPLARTLLSLIARDPAGARRDGLDLALDRRLPDAATRAARLTYLLDVLENDGYVVQATDRLRFRSNLLRDYWVARVAS